MARLICLLVLAACVPLTEAQRDERAYQWQEHVVAWKIFEEACRDAGGHVLNRHARPCRVRECIPAPYEWRHWYDENGRLRWNSATVFCAK